jgi:hypothetical protein
MLKRRSSWRPSTRSTTSSLGDDSQVRGKYAKEEATLEAKQEIKNLLKEMTLKSEVNVLRKRPPWRPSRRSRTSSSRR